MSQAALESYGMVQVGRIELPDERTFFIRLEHNDAGCWSKAIYAFVVGDKIMRIGSSKGSLRVRMNEWTRGVTKSLQGLKSERERERTLQDQIADLTSHLDGNAKERRQARAALTALLQVEPPPRGGTPAWEAEGWRASLTKHGGGQVFARTATRVTTPVGTFEAYMDEESVLINRHKPPLNRHTNR